MSFTSQFLRGASVLALFQVLASVAGLIRDRVLASTFPDLNVVDVYIAAFRPSDLLFQMTIMAGYSVALVPMMAGLKGDQASCSRFLSGVINVACLVFGVITVVGIVVFPWIASTLVQFQGETLRLYILFGRLALVSNLLFVISNALGQFLITEERYWIYGLTPVLYTVGTIVGTLWLTPIIGPLGPIVGTLCGGVFYLLLRLLDALHLGFRWSRNLWHGDLSELVHLMLPRMIALGVLQFVLLYFDRIASGLPAGSVTINAYARNVQSVAVGVVGIAVAQALFSQMSKASGDPDRFHRLLRKGTVFILLLTVPGAVVLSQLSPIAAGILSLSHVLPLFHLCLLCYCISIPFESLNHLLLRSFYARKQTRIPACLSVLNGLIAITVSWMLVPHLGVLSLAVGFTVGQVVQIGGLVLSYLLPSAPQQ